MDIVINHGILHTPTQAISMDMTGISTDTIEAPSLSPTKTNSKIVHIHAQEYPQELKHGLNEIARFCPHQNLSTKESMDSYDDEHAISVHLQFIQDSNLYNMHTVQSILDESISTVKYSTTIRYHRKCDAYKALGRILGTVFEMNKNQCWKVDIQWTETCQFDTCGVMVDVSRNAVLLLDKVELLIRKCALMGLSTFQLYTEDTYKVPNEPLFGYFRGGYSHQDLKSLDDYACNFLISNEWLDEFGIELFACIQTLGHMGQTLQWPLFSKIKDTSEVLLVNSNDTYEFIETCIDTITSPLRSKRVLFYTD
jgi:hypothetical protein